MTILAEPTLVEVAHERTPVLDTPTNTGSYLNRYPVLGRPFGSYNLHDPSQSPNIESLRAKASELYETFLPLGNVDFTEGFNLRGDNKDHFILATGYRHEYLPFHSKNLKHLPADVAVKAITDYQHYVHHLGNLVDGKEQALPTGVFSINGRQYFNARMDNRSYLFIVRDDEEKSVGQFTGLVMQSGVSQEEWLNLGQDIEDLAVSGVPIIKDTDNLQLSNGSWVRPHAL